MSSEKTLEDPKPPLVITEEDVKDLGKMLEREKKKFMKSIKTKEAKIATLKTGLRKLEVQIQPYEDKLKEHDTKKKEVAATASATITSSTTSAGVVTGNSAIALVTQSDIPLGGDSSTALAPKVISDATSTSTISATHSATPVAANTSPTQATTLDITWASNSAENSLSCLTANNVRALVYTLATALGAAARTSSSTSVKSIPAVAGIKAPLENSDDRKRANESEKKSVSPRKFAKLEGNEKSDYLENIVKKIKSKNAENADATQ